MTEKYIAYRNKKLVSAVSQHYKPWEIVETIRTINIAHTRLEDIALLKGEEFYPWLLETFPRLKGVPVKELLGEKK